MFRHPAIPLLKAGPLFAETGNTTRTIHILRYVLFKDKKGLLVTFKQRFYLKTDAGWLGEEIGWTPGRIGTQYLERVVRASFQRRKDYRVTDW